MNEAWIKEGIARELSREVRLQNALAALPSEEEIEAWWRWFILSQYFVANGHERGKYHFG